MEITNEEGLKIDPRDELIYRKEPKEKKYKRCRICRNLMEYENENKTTCWDCVQKRKKGWYKRNKARINLEEREKKKKLREDKKLWKKELQEERTSVKLGAEKLGT